MSVEPLGPNPVDWAVSSAISTAVAFSVSQDTLTARSPQSRSEVADVERGHLGVGRRVVSVVVRRSWSSGQLVSSIVPSVRVVPQSVAPSRFVPVIVALVRFALVRSASDRSASTICAPLRSASVRFAPLRFVPVEIRAGESRAGEVGVLEIRPGEVDVRARRRRLDDAAVHGLRSSPIHRSRHSMAAARATVSVHCRASLTCSPPRRSRSTGDHDGWCERMSR